MIRSDRAVIVSRNKVGMRHCSFVNIFVTYCFFSIKVRLSNKIKYQRSYHLAVGIDVKAYAGLPLKVGQIEYIIV